MKIFLCPNCKQMRELPALAKFSCLGCGLWFKVGEQTQATPAAKAPPAFSEPAAAAIATPKSTPSQLPLFQWDVEAAVLLRFLSKLLPPAARAAAYDRLKAGLQAAMVFRIQEWAAAERAAFLGRSGPSLN